MLQDGLFSVPCELEWWIEDCHSLRCERVQTLSNQIPILWNPYARQPLRGFQSLFVLGCPMR